ncbi:serine hydrolase domain-containing protein [Thalassotalea ganghwensis]
MTTWLKRIGPVMLLLMLWVWLVFYSTVNGWFREAIAPIDDFNSFNIAASDILRQQFKGNVAFALIESGKVTSFVGYSIGTPITEDTIFQVSSLGKWVAAVGVMTMVNDGLVSLDTPVSTYLRSWQLPSSQFDNDQVTIRRLLSHTAGLTDGLGHNGFTKEQQVQPLVEHLNQAKDADEGVSGKVEVGLKPGKQFKYSGGGYNLLQLLIEDVTGVPFSEYMQQRIFEPLGMKNSGYYISDNNPLLANYYDDKGAILAYPQYTSLAATGLYTSVNDLAKFMRIHLTIVDENLVNSRLISQALLKEMRQPEASMLGLPIWGAGPIIFNTYQDDYVFGHDGKSPFLNTSARLNPVTGNGIIVLQTGNQTLATDIASEWTFWETGKRDLIMIKNSVPRMIKTVLFGWLSIIILTFVYFYCVRRKNKQLKSG